VKVGDLVKRKPVWDKWVEHNPWMYTAKDLEIGIVVFAGEGSTHQVLWPDGVTWNLKEDLLKANEKLKEREG